MVSASVNGLLLEADANVLTGDADAKHYAYGIRRAIEVLHPFLTTRTRDTLSFAYLRERNLVRMPMFHPLDDWSPTDWACAMAGEVGEACNFIKKLRRIQGSGSVYEELRGEIVANIGKELADTVCYADLLAARLRLDLGQLVWDKFNEISHRRGVAVYMEEETA